MADTEQRVSDSSSGDRTTRYMYRMDHPRRGKFIVISNENFDPQMKASQRFSSDLDAATLFVVFKQLGFDVSIHRNLRASEMLELMIAVSKDDHSACDCLGVAVLSHGSKDDLLFGIDDVISVESLVEPVKNCRTLNGKPKLFFFQACRGVELDEGQDQCDSVDDALAESTVRRLPREADCLYAYCTPPRHFAWRNNKKGSWFIQSLCQQLKKHVDTLDLVSILTRVNHQVALEYQSNCPSRPEIDCMKQVPSIVSMLTKDVYFTRLKT